MVNWNLIMIMMMMMAMILMMMIMSKISWVVHWNLVKKRVRVMRKL